MQLLGCNAMHTDVQKLHSLMNKKQGQIIVYRQQMERLNLQLVELQGQINGIAESIQALGGFDNTPKQAAVKTNDSTHSSLSDEVLGLIQREGRSPGLVVPEIIDRLQAGGFKSNAK